MKNNDMKANNKTLLAIMAFTLVSCFQSKEKEVVLYPSFYVEDYRIVYNDNDIVIKACCKDSVIDKWDLVMKNGEYYISDRGKKYLFLSTKREWDTVCEVYPDFPKHIVTQKLNDSLFVSSFNQTIIHEGMLLEVVYDKFYKIKQARHQTMWLDYTPKGVKAIKYIPFIYSNGRDD